MHFTQKTTHWREVWQLIRPYWVSEEKVSAWTRLFAIVVLTLAAVYINVLFNEWNRVFYDALQNRNYAVFKAQLIRFSYLAFIYIAIAIFRIYLTQGLQMLWRQWMTRRYMDKWLGHQAYYHTEMQQSIDNPDQRIAQDLNTLTSGTLSLTLGFLSSLVTLFSFVTILWSVSGSLSLMIAGHALEIPGYMVWFALLYAGLGSMMIWLVGRPLVDLSFDQERFEANFHFGLIRIRHSADPIALYHGEQQERRQLEGQFQNIRRNWWNIMRLTRRLNFASNFYGQFAIIFPILVAAPRYFANAIQLGTLMQISSAFGQVQEALSWFINAFDDLASWKACVNRLAGFNKAVEEINRHPGDIRHGQTQCADEALNIKALTLQLHQGRTLFNNVTLRVLRGDRVLITGPSGCGKSTLLSAIAGVWPYGHGEILRPDETTLRTLFLPQHSYLPIGSLREAICYPYNATTYSDDELKAILRACRLSHLCDALGSRSNWSQQLSPGEQQRIAFARALALRPDILYLDEATSALDEDTEQHVYRLLEASLPGVTLISVAHRSSVAPFHTLRWRFHREAEDDQGGEFAPSQVEVSTLGEH
ncbi:ABC-type uncharacterized transport system, permease and ATPase components [Edwardsiella anguillarum]|uniref:ABC transporter ATP-binding protein/permease n=1 Tax=Edwardsiella TaxID=635 RepID=UPI00045C87F9|nr:ABC transporter ATP-binding protein/permease [Edwardsiella anguillarum]AKM48040.1 ABC transporter ATP-binding protein [Edwardsiella sp. EA181011]GAJ68383.1 ABC transporter, ATP-binding protein [Edwardsiella piscicida]RFT03855.1 ABC transporter ATP-binding protein [Edwardsiella anguillarum]BET80707.1 ABC-type uncharacterized transport system, permease and ATPase components [Edwardsiella anguillarum]BET83996.1 ABC-type uncharacterized transport system, permease and ATPase components [Edwardsi